MDVEEEEINGFEEGGRKRRRRRNREVIEKKWRPMKTSLFTENVNTIYVIQQIVLLVLLVRQTVLLVRQIVLLIKKTVLLARQTQLLVLLVRQIVWVKISTTPGGPPYATRANNISIFYYIQPSLVLCRKLFLQKFFVQLMSNSLR